MSQRPNKRKRAWSAVDLADRIKTKTQAQRRLNEIAHMQGRHFAKKREAEIMIKKLAKEHALLRQRWDLPYVRHRSHAWTPECEGEAVELPLEGEVESQ